MLILDELHYAEQLIKNGLETDYPKLRDLVVIAKYYAHEDLDIHSIRLKLNEICYKTDKKFNMTLNGWKINKALSSTKLYRLRIPFPVVVTKKELEIIQRYDDYNYRKILFVLLVYAKFLKYASTRIKPSTRLRQLGEFYVNEKFSNIVKVARVSIKKDKRDRFLHQMYLDGLLDGTSYGTLLIKYVQEESDPEIIVTDLENLVLAYQRYCGEQVIGCKCGRLFLKKSNRHSMCRICWKERQRELWRINKQKNKIPSLDNISL